MLYPHPQIYHHLKTIFVHVPKAAGTSIEHTLKEPGTKSGGHTTALAYRNHFPTEFASYFKFAIVRQPIARFISAWTYLRAWPLLSALNNQLIKECASADAFCAMAKADPKVMQGIVHLHTQESFLCDRTGAVIIDHIYKCESLDSAWLDICDRAGLKTQLPKMNVSKKGEPVSLNGCSLGFLKAFYARDFELFGYESPT